MIQEQNTKQSFLASHMQWHQVHLVVATRSVRIHNSTSDNFIRVWSQSQYPRKGAGFHIRNEEDNWDSGTLASVRTQNGNRRIRILGVKLIIIYLHLF